MKLQTQNRIKMFYLVIGWIGVFVFILAYLLLSLEIVSSDKITYHWLNVVGAICLVVNAIGIQDYPSLTVNAVWGIIALFTIVKLLLKSIRLNKIK